MDRIFVSRLPCLYARERNRCFTCARFYNRLVAILPVTERGRWSVTARIGYKIALIIFVPASQRFFFPAAQETNNDEMFTLMYQIMALAKKNKVSAALAIQNLLHWFCLVCCFLAPFSLLLLNYYTLTQMRFSILFFRCSAISCPCGRKKAETKKLT